MVRACVAHVLSRYLQLLIKILGFNTYYSLRTCICDHSILELKPAVISRIKA